jgi:ATP-dependent helicase HrpB
MSRNFNVLSFYKIPQDVSNLEVIYARLVSLWRETRFAARDESRLTYFETYSMIPKKLELPVDSLLPQICSTIRSGKDLILKASPGSGKTTRVPPALLPEVSGQIWVLEPRRLAARMSAVRVASEMGEQPGMTVGWQMRFDSSFSSSTRVLFLTEGMFTARLAQDPSLRGVSCVILDEFHERHQQTDVAFALCRHLQNSTRPDLRLIVMSATLDTKSLVEAFPSAVLISVENPLFPIQVEYWRGDFTENFVDRAISGSIQLTNNPSHAGHILVFLPGTAEIIRVKAGLVRQLSSDKWLILELRGSIGKEEQNLAFEDHANADKIKLRKIILATNIAESSITIPGVTAVVDTGLARVPSFNLFTGMSSLETKSVSKASIVQRSGRAGRTGPGINLRLFTEHDEASRPEIDVPEISRLDLAQVYMSLLWLAHKTKSTWLPDQLPWLTPPDSKQWDDAKKHLKMLTLLTDHGTLRHPEIALLPVHPRLARFAMACTEHGLQNEAPWLTALLANPGDVVIGPGDYTHLGCDLLAQYESFRSKPGRARNVQQSAQQISRLLNRGPLVAIDQCLPPHEISLAKPLLQAFPDRVIFIRSKGGKSHWIDATICGGGDLRMVKESAAAHGDWLIALDVSSTRVAGSVNASSQKNSHFTQTLSSNNQTTVIAASQITPAELSTAPAGFYFSEDVSEWDEKAGKSRIFRKTKYGVLPISSQIVIESTPLRHLRGSPVGTSLDGRTQQDSDLSPLGTGQVDRQVDRQAEHQATLEKNILKLWPKPFEDSIYFDAYVIRQKIAFDVKLSSHAWDKEELRELLVSQICGEATSFAEVLLHPLEHWLRICVGEQEFTALQKIAPTTITVGIGHKVAVHYSETSSPWIEARLQNFFGQANTPKIFDGRIPLTLHLLAPNMRALQVTKDLSSFWQVMYPSLRNEYMRKYPRHYWPENPLEAEPPAMRERHKGRRK